MNKTHDQQIEVALSEYFAGIDAGTPIDTSELVAKYPDVAEVLQQFLTDEQQLVAACEQMLGGLTANDKPLPVGPNDTLGDFRLIREIGRGGMGIVYEAKQQSLGRSVALKILPIGPTYDRYQVARFQNEARAAALLNHPHIVPVFSVGCDQGVHHIAMQLVVGRCLADIIASERSAPPTDSPRRRVRRTAELGIQAAEALAYSHTHGVLHRDIKPSNLLIDQAHGNLWISDFGVSRIGHDQALTLTGSLVGTLSYMSPEQAAGRQAAVDPRADIYSLGATLYELAALEPAIAGGEPIEQLRKIQSGDVRPLRQLDRRIPKDFETIIGKAMRVEPDDRYASALDLAADFRRFLAGEPIEAKPVSAAERCAKWLRRHPALVCGVTLGLATLCVVLLISSLLVNRARVDAEAALAQKSELLYVADMVEAYDAWQHGWLDKVPGILARQLPPQGQRDYRGLEWHALDRQLGAANVTKMHAHLGAATEVTALGSGAAVASVGEDGYLRIWDVAKGKSQSIRIAGEPLHAIAATPDGQQIAVAGQAVYLVNLAEGSGPKIIKRFNHTVESMAFGPEAATLAVGVRYHEVCLLSPSGEVISRFDCDSRVDTLEYVPWLDGFLIASRKLQADGRGASVIQLWDTKLAQRKRQFTGNSSLGFSQLTYAKSLPERRQILVGSLYESKAGLLDAVSGSAVALVPIGRDQISTIACSPTGGRFAVAYAGGTVDMFNADSQQASSIVLRPEASVQAHRTGSITSMALLASGAVATSGADGQVNLWESPPGDHLWIHRENREIRSIAFSSAGTSLACGVADAVCVLSAEGKQRARWSMSETVEDIAWSPAGDAIVVCNSGSRHVDVFAPDGTKRLAIPVDGIARSAAYSPDGRWLAIVGENYLLLCDAASGALKRKVALTSPAEAIAISPCGKQIAIGGHRCYEIEIYGIDLLGSPEVLEVDRGVESLTYSADGSILVSGHADSVIRVWNTHAGRLASELVGHSLGVKKLVLSPEGRTLLSASSDGQLRAWSMPHCRLFGVLSHQPYIADHGSQGVGRPITVAISQRYLAIGKTGATDRSELTVWSLD